MARIREALPYVLAAVLAVTAGVLWYYAIALSVDRLDGSSRVPREDVVAFYAAARLLREGRGQELYDPVVMHGEEAEVLGRSAGFHGGLAYLNPPFVAALFYPLTFLPYGLAQAVWLAVDVAALVAALALLAPELRRLERRWAAVFVLGVLASFPVFASILYVQLSPLIFLSWVASYRLLRAGREHWGGLALAASLIKPPLALGPALFLLTRGRWRPLIAFAGAGLALAAVSVALVGPDVAFGDYPGLLLKSMTWRFQFGVNRPHMFGWSGFFSLVMGERLSALERPLTIAASAITLLATLYLWRKLRGEENRGRRLLTVGIATVLISPHIHTQDLLVLVLPLAVMVSQPRGPFDVVVPALLLPLSAIAVTDFNLATPFLAGVLGYLALKEAGASLRPSIPLPRRFLARRLRPLTSVRQPGQGEDAF